MTNKLKKPSVSYSFGDAGSSWRMTKLKSVYRIASERAAPVEQIAIERYGNLRLFDDAREEETELDRRKMYGKCYTKKEKPDGNLYDKRNLDTEVKVESTKEGKRPAEGLPPCEVVESHNPNQEPPLNHTELNKLRAKLLKANMLKDPNAATLEDEYNALISSGKSSEPSVVMLSAMENRMLTGGRSNEVKPVETRRGKKRGQVEESEDMSISDMIRQEKRGRGQGGEGLLLAKRIAKDASFSNDLEYMDENAHRLAKRIQKSEINLRDVAISDVQRMNRILDTCPLCHDEEKGKLPIAPIVSLATRVYLTLPTEPEISDGGACIVPIQHRKNLIECDNDEWEEIRNFMKSLTRMYHDQGRDVIFYENASQPHRRKHAAMEVVPLPYDVGGTAPAFFKEAILTADQEWTQHKKIINTLEIAKNNLGKHAFRRSLAKEMPYFHVWFELDGGLGHVVEDANRWPKGDLFAREVIGGMLDACPSVIRRQGRWNRVDGRVERFGKRWRKFDWTRLLTEE